MTFPRYQRLSAPTGSVRFRVYGSTRYELLENAGEAMFSVGRDLTSIPPTYSRPLVAPGDGYEELLENWLVELLHLAAQESMVWSYCVVDRLEPGGVQGSASGQPHGRVRPGGPVVTGIAGLESPIVEIPDGWWVDVAFVVDRDLRVV